MATVLTYERFHDIFNRYYSSLCVFANRYLDDKAMSADVAQDAFMMLWKKRKDFDGELKIKSFLYTSVHNKSLNELSRRKTVKEHNKKLNLFTISELFQERVIEEETCRILLEEIDRLPSQMREIILRTLDGMTNREIAEDLSISAETVHSLKKIAYRKLKENLKDLYYLLLIFLLFKN